MADLDDELRAAVQACDVTPVVKSTSVRDAADIDVSAVVTGTLQPAGYFEASHIQPQCPSKYGEAQRKGAVMPHAAVQ